MLVRLRRSQEALETFAVDVVYDRRNDGWAQGIGKFLSVLSHIFSGIVQSRFFLYNKRVFRDQTLGCLVVVVGNLTVGGTGKTPVVEKFARSLSERGRKVAILSRGYKARKEPKWRQFMRWITHTDAPPPKVVSDGNELLLGPHEAGDEPYMLARNLPGVLVLCDKNRVKAGHYAIKEFGCDTLILDDGFQYLPLKGRLNLLLIDKTNPFGNHHLLPRGVLREPVKHLKRASYIFLTKSDGKPDAALDTLIRTHKPDAEIIECTHKPRYLREVNGDRELELEDLKGKRVAAFSGIAVPESFENLLRKLGVQIVYNRRFLDHHWFSPEELRLMFARATRTEVDYMLTTEKDAVRIPRDFESSLPFFYLRMEIAILAGADDFEQAVSKICFPKSKIKSTRAPFRVR